MGEIPRSARIEKALAVIAQDLRSLSTDVNGLRHDLEAAQREYRDEIRALRGDLALSESKQNAEIEGNKKKSFGSFRALPASTAVWWTLRKRWRLSGQSSSPKPVN